MSEAMQESSIYNEPLRHPFPPPPQARNHLILHQCPNYIVLNKPYDLRMDGDYPQTVHKLLTHWYPPSSLSKMNTNEIEKKVMSISKFNDLNDNQLRPCHELDYATSGVLLVARSREAAAMACKQFCERTTKKRYIAVLHGHVKSSDFLPVVSKETFDSTWNNGSHEHKYRKMRDNRDKVTFKGYLPVHSVLAKWKSSIKRSKVNGEDELLKKTENGIADVKTNELISICGGGGVQIAIPRFPLDDEIKIMSLKWNKVKQNPSFKHSFEVLTKQYNESLNGGESSIPTKKSVSRKKARISPSSSIEGKAHNDTKQTELPRFFRLEADDAEKQHKDIADNNTFYINARIAKDDGKFQMILENSKNDAIQTDPKLHTIQNDTTSPLDYKPALTKISVLWKGMMGEDPVTKVLFTPHTGRRHQLRLHALAAGHPIVGDVTYASAVDAISQKRQRMCLHAHTLSIPLLDEVHGNFVAPDPFQIKSDTVSNQDELPMTNCGLSWYDTTDR